eukprot:scaffold112724_cov42-Attheya_sp.AAC.2
MSSIVMSSIVVSSVVAALPRRDTIGGVVRLTERPKSVHSSFILHHPSSSLQPRLRPPMIDYR